MLNKRVSIMFVFTVFFCMISANIIWAGNNDTKYVPGGPLIGPNTVASSNRGIGPYIGIGGSYAYEDFDLGKLGLSVDFDNTYGLNLKVGYHFNRLFSLEFNFDFLPGFECDDSITYLGFVPINMNAEVDITTYMLAGKISPDFGSEIIRPFVVAGFGIMHSEIDVAILIDEYPILDTNFEEVDICAKIGAGIDFFVNENISIGLEGNYVLGIGNVDIFRYMKYTLGVAYHF